MIKDIVKKCRSYRRFYENEPVSREELADLVDTARYTASAANRQPIRYRIVTGSEDCAKVYSTLGWAGYLSDWDGPEEGERPTGYIILLGRENINSNWDEGIIAQTVLLAAVEKGYGGCMLGNVKKDVLADMISIPEGYVIKLVIAIGKPREEIVIDDIPSDGDIKYYREANGIHHVPKVVTEDLIV